MRKLLIAIIVLMFLVGSNEVLAYTYDGELNPNEFGKWQVLNIRPDIQGFFWVFAQNPDPDSPIKIVSMAIDYNSHLLSYRYFQNGQPYEFVFDPKQEKYVRHHFTDQQKRGCMRCHQGRIVPSASI